MGRKKENGFLTRKLSGQLFLTWICRESYHLNKCKKLGNISFVLSDIMLKSCLSLSRDTLSFIKNRLNDFLKFFRNFLNAVKKRQSSTSTTNKRHSTAPWYNTLSDDNGKLSEEGIIILQIESDAYHQNAEDSRPIQPTCPAVINSDSSKLPSLNLEESDFDSIDGFPYFVKDASTAGSDTPQQLSCTNEQDLTVAAYASVTTTTMVDKSCQTDDLQSSSQPIKPHSDPEIFLNKNFRLTESFEEVKSFPVRFNCRDETIPTSSFTSRPNKRRRQTSDCFMQTMSLDDFPSICFNSRGPEEEQLLEDFIL